MYLHQTSVWRNVEIREWFRSLVKSINTANIDLNKSKLYYPFLSNVIFNKELWMYL